MSDHLPNEVMMDILARLPVRTLLQIRCVCKSWCSLITSENFVTFRLNRTTHLNNINNTHLLLIKRFIEREKQEHISLYLDDEALTEYQYLNLENRPIAYIYSHFTILGSCNGLVCLIDDIMSTADFLYLWNPTIRKFVVLPQPRITFQSHGGYDRALGFGFDSTTNDYKVVRIVYLQVSGGTEVDIYSLKEGCWRNISVSGPIHDIDYTSSNAYLNGAIHWVSRDRHCRQFIALFNLGTEVFSQMALPSSLGPRWLSVAVFQDSLCVFHNYSYEGKVSIWVMKEYGVVESWTNLFCLDFYKGDFVKAVGLKRNGEVLLAHGEEMISVDRKARRLKNVVIRGHLLLTTDDEMISDDIKAPKLKYVGICGYHKAFSVKTYTESLVLIDKVNRFGEQARYSPLQAQRR